MTLTVVITRGDWWHWVLSLAILAWVLWRLLGPATSVLWADRRMLAHALWMRVRHPRLWAEAKRDVAAGEPHA